MITQEDIDSEIMFEFLCGTFTPNGWIHTGTGGGCTAIIIDDGEDGREDGKYWMIAHEAQSPETIDSPATIFLCDADGDYLSYFEVDRLKDITFDRETFTIKKRGE